MKSRNRYLVSGIPSRLVGLWLILLLVPLASLAQAPTLGEAVDNTDLPWASGGDASWFGQTAEWVHDGDAAKSGDISVGQTSWIETTVEGPGLLSFYWRTYCRDLSFSIGGEVQATYFGDWAPELLAVPTGEHTLRWTFARQVPVGSPAYLDWVVYEPGPGARVESPNGGESWQQRQAYDITWAATEDAGDTVRIDLCRDGGTCQSIAPATENDGLHRWFVPVTVEPQSDYRIQIRGTDDPSLQDDSDAVFSIVAASQPALKGVLVLDGEDDYAEAADQAELDVGTEPASSLTVEAWVNYRAFDRGGIVVHPGSLSLSMWVDEYSHPWLYCFSFAGYTPGASQPYALQSCHSPAPASNDWHHIAAVVDGSLGQLTLYLDGEKDGQMAFPTTGLVDSAEPLLVGANIMFTGEWTYFAGLIDEVRISDIARYSGDSPGLPPGPFLCDTNTRALWHFDELEGAIVFQDACGPVNNLLDGHNGAHAEGTAGTRIFLPLVLRETHISHGQWVPVRATIAKGANHYQVREWTLPVLAGRSHRPEEQRVSPNDP
jgi:hypothetical protein